MSVDGNLPTFGVAPRREGLALFGAEGTYDEAACRADSTGRQAPITLGTTGDTVTFSSYFDGWGYVHLLANKGGKMTALDTYAVPEAHDQAYASGHGDLSVHEVATSRTDASRQYLSYYSAGFRVTRIENGKLVEKGHYIASGGSNFWGVEVFSHANREYVAASDRDGGLWILRYTGR